MDCPLASFLFSLPLTFFVMRLQLQANDEFKIEFISFEVRSNKHKGFG